MRFNLNFCNFFAYHKLDALVSMWNLSCPIFQPFQRIVLPPADLCSLFPSAMHPMAMHRMVRCDFYPNVTSEIQNWKNKLVKRNVNNVGIRWQQRKALMRVNYNIFQVDFSQTHPDYWISHLKKQFSSIRDSWYLLILWPHCHCSQQNDFTFVFR